MDSRSIKLNIIKTSKDFLLATRILQIFQPLNKLFSFISNFNMLTSWVHKHKNDKLLLNDFYRPKRLYSDREKSFQAIVDNYKLDTTPIRYLEFGVASASSFKWWLKNSSNSESIFYGFDTFEGLPEKWGLYEKGAMEAPIPDINDKRAKFIKGIFQDTLFKFLQQNGSSILGVRKVIHLDADLFSSTLFTLSQLYPYLEKGDIIMFDEFNVYNHEFLAYKIFTDCFYVKMKPISAQNNFYHIAFEVE